VAVAEEVQESEAAEDLELLSDFGADVVIVRMKSGEFGFE
jgi:hypothetical protein